MIRTMWYMCEEIDSCEIWKWKPETWSFFFFSFFLQLLDQNEY